MFDIENSPGFLLAKCHKKAFQRFKKKLEPFNLTPPQFGALTFLWQKDGINQIELGQLMGTDRTTISGIIERLEMKGYVQRKPSSSDKRSLYIFNTEKGNKLKYKLFDVAREHNSFLLNSLGKEEKSELIRILKKLETAINDE